MSRRLAGIAAAVLFTLSLATPATAGEGDHEAANFARERGISPAAAAQRLRWQVAAPDLAGRLATDLSGRFGGVWIDVHNGDRVKVGVVGGPDPLISQSVRSVAEPLGLAGAYDLVAVRYSEAELLRHNEWLGAQIATSGLGGGLTAGVRTDLNAIEVQPTGTTVSQAQASLIADAKAHMGDRLVIGAALGQAKAWGCVYPYCDAPLRGGIKINGSLHPCSGGFVAQSKVDDKYYQFTAGHCIDGGANDDWWTKFTDGSGHDLGPWHHWLWHGAGDMAIVHVNNVDGWDPKGWVQVTSGPDTTADPDYEINSDNYSVIGMRICITGAYYGRSDCGTVTHLGVTVTYGGVTVHNFGRSTACGTPGDSGGPMYASHVAYGLVMGGYSECQSFYQGIRDAEVRLNVNVVHE